jgi:hypothetical protein
MLGWAEERKISLIHIQVRSSHAEQPYGWMGDEPLALILFT